MRKDIHPVTYLRSFCITLAVIPRVCTGKMEHVGFLLLGCVLRQPPFTSPGKRMSLLNVCAVSTDTARLLTWRMEGLHCSCGLQTLCYATFDDSSESKTNKQRKEIGNLACVVKNMRSSKQAYIQHIHTFRGFLFSVGTLQLSCRMELMIQSCP